MAKTKKVGIAGRFGPRYGSRVRNNWREIMERLKGENRCPRCETKARNMRDFIGVWSCPKCNAKWTGGAWEPATSRGKEAVRIASRIAREMHEAEEAEAKK
jgi:large subunit ribosomal protein L37Ae